MPSKVYILHCVGWDYNDEYYFTMDDCAGYAQKAFTDKAEALAACRDANRKALREIDTLDNYITTGGDVSDIISGDHSVKELIAVLNPPETEGEAVVDGLGDDDIDSHGLDLQIGCYEWTDDQIDRLLEILNLEFYTVEEVDLCSTPAR